MLERTNRLSDPSYCQAARYCKQLDLPSETAAPIAEIYAIERNAPENDKMIDQKVFDKVVAIILPKKKKEFEDLYPNIFSNS